MEAGANLSLLALSQAFIEEIYYDMVVAFTLFTSCRRQVQATQRKISEISNSALSEQPQDAVAGINSRSICSGSTVDLTSRNVAALVSSPGDGSAKWALRFLNHATIDSGAVCDGSAESLAGAESNRGRLSLAVRFGCL